MLRGVKGRGDLNQPERMLRQVQEGRGDLNQPERMLRQVQEGRGDLKIGRASC